MARVLGLIFGLALSLLCSVVYAADPPSSGAYEDPAAAIAACQASAVFKNKPTSPYACGNFLDKTGNGAYPLCWFVYRTDGGGPARPGTASFCAKAPSEPCSSNGSSTVRLGAYYETPGPLYSTIPGTACQCTFFMRAAWRADQPGGPLTIGTCSGTGRYWGDAGSEPSPPADAGPGDAANPCDGGALSCMAPDGRFCYGSEGKQVCVDGPDGPSGPHPGETPPHCSQGDGFALCAGSPNAPQPQPKPEGEPLGDENILTSDGAGAAPSNTQIITWDTTGQGNNADPGDGSDDTGSTGNGGNNGSEGKPDPNTGKCSDGSIPTASGCGAGYTDNGCDTPPTCSGDVLQCAALREQHATRCAAAKRAADFADADKARADLTAAGLPAEPGEPNGDDLVKAVEVGDGSGSGDGTSLDASGYGYATTCPIHPVTFTLAGQTVEVDYSKACEYLDLGGWIVMILSYLAAARIISEGK